MSLFEITPDNEHYFYFPLKRPEGDVRENGIKYPAWRVKILLYRQAAVGSYMSEGVLLFLRASIYLLRETVLARQKDNSVLTIIKGIASLRHHGFVVFCDPAQNLLALVVLFAVARNTIFKEAATYDHHPIGWMPFQIFYDPVLATAGGGRRKIKKWRDRTRTPRKVINYLALGYDQ